MKLHHVAIQVLDLDQARAFYVDVLGLPLLRTQEHALWVRAGEAIVMLELPAGGAPGAVADVDDSPWKSPHPGPLCVAFAIAPAERADLRARLVAAGVAVHHESAFTLYVRDPFGARLGFSHYPDVA